MNPARSFAFRLRGWDEIGRNIISSAFRYSLVYVSLCALSLPPLEMSDRQHNTIWASQLWAYSNHFLDSVLDGNFWSVAENISCLVDIVISIGPHVYDLFSCEGGLSTEA